MEWFILVLLILAFVAYQIIKSVWKTGEYNRRASRNCCSSRSGKQKVNFTTRTAAQRRVHQYGGSIYECVNQPGTYHHRSSR